jgi:hypothetical protein
MAKRKKLFGDQYLGFWGPGLLLFALQEVPYIVMPLFDLASNPIMNMQEHSLPLDVFEKILGALCIVLMVFVVSENDRSIGSRGNGKIFFRLAIAILLLNYLGWTLYFSGHQSLFIMMFFIVMLPPLYYVSIGLWRNNVLLIGVGSLFEVIHFTHVWINLYPS